MNANPNTGPNAGFVCSDDQVVVGGVTSLWRSSFQPVTGGATISFQLDCLFSNLLYVTKMNSQKLPKSSINADEFFVAYPATLASKRERLITQANKKNFFQKADVGSLLG